MKPLCPHLLAGLAIVLAATVAGAAPPANDNFANAITIGALPYTDTKSTVEATSEVGEPVSYCGGSSTTIWYKLVAPSSGNIVFDSAGSNFDNELHLFKGTTIANVQSIDCNDDAIGFQSRLPAVVEAGQTYYIKVNGFSTNSGTHKLNVSTITPPLFTQCPAIGRNAGCEYLVTADPGSYTIQTDPNEYSFSALTNAGLVGVVNDTGAPLCTLGWTDPGSFSLSGPQYALCGERTNPHPGSCPFGTTLWEGPGVTFEQSWDTNSGVVHFEPCIPDGDSAYFGITGSPSDGFYVCNGNEICEVGETTTNCRHDCPPDTDGDTVLDNADNCIYSDNADQADVDADDTGNICDGLDNVLLVKQASMKTKSTGVLAQVKGTLNEVEPTEDLPNAIGGVYTLMHDQAYMYIETIFAVEECVQTAKKIICAKPDKSASLKIPLGGYERGKVPFKLKVFVPEAFPPLYAGPVVLYITDLDSSVDRQGTSPVECFADDRKLVCK
jgi:hypothetical protein